MKLQLLTSTGALALFGAGSAAASEVNTIAMLAMGSELHFPLTDVVSSLSADHRCLLITSPMEPSRCSRKDGATSRVALTSARR